MHVGVVLGQFAAHLHTDGGRAAQPQVEQHQLGHLGSHEFPEFGFGGSCAYNLGLWYFGVEDLLCALKLKLHILHDDDFE